MKYAITQTTNGWEIFEDGVTWGVSFPDLFSAHTAMILILKAIEKAQG